METNDPQEGKASEREVELKLKVTMEGKNDAWLVHRISKGGLYHGQDSPLERLTWLALELGKRVTRRTTTKEATVRLYHHDEEGREVLLDSVEQLETAWRGSKDDVFRATATITPLQVRSYGAQCDSSSVAASAFRVSGVARNPKEAVSVSRVVPSTLPPPPPPPPESVGEIDLEKEEEDKEYWSGRNGKVVSVDSKEMPDGLDVAFLHGKSQCNVCRRIPIIGIRYRARHLPDYDLCRACFLEYGEGQVFDAVESGHDRHKQKTWRRRELRRVKQGRKPALEFTPKPPPVEEEDAGKKEPDPVETLQDSTGAVAGATTVEDEQETVDDVKAVEKSFLEAPRDAPSFPDGVVQPVTGVKLGKRELAEDDGPPLAPPLPEGALEAATSESREEAPAEDMIAAEDAVSHCEHHVVVDHGDDDEERVEGGSPKVNQNVEELSNKSRDASPASVVERCKDGQRGASNDKDDDEDSYRRFRQRHVKGTIPAPPLGFDPNFIHKGRFCFGPCRETPIIGIRYHAVNLENTQFDLCFKCFSTYEWSGLQLEPVELEEDRRHQAAWRRKELRWQRQVWCAAVPVEERKSLLRKAEPVRLDGRNLYGVRTPIVEDVAADHGEDAVEAANQEWITMDGHQVDAQGESKPMQRLPNVAPTECEIVVKEAEERGVAPLGEPRHAASGNVPMDNDCSFEAAPHTAEDTLISFDEVAAEKKELMDDATAESPIREAPAESKDTVAADPFKKASVPDTRESANLSQVKADGALEEKIVVNGVQHGAEEYEIVSTKGEAAHDVDDVEEAQVVPQGAEVYPSTIAGTGAAEDTEEGIANETEVVAAVCSVGGTPHEPSLGVSTETKEKHPLVDTPACETIPHDVSVGGCVAEKQEAEAEAEAVETEAMPKCDAISSSEAKVNEIEDVALGDTMRTATNMEGESGTKMSEVDTTTTAENDAPSVSSWTLRSNELDVAVANSDLGELEELLAPTGDTVGRQDIDSATKSTFQLPPLSHTCAKSISGSTRDANTTGLAVSTSATPAKEPHELEAGSAVAKVDGYAKKSPTDDSVSHMEVNEDFPHTPLVAGGTLPFCGDADKQELPRKDLRQSVDVHHSSPAVAIQNGSPPCARGDDKHATRQGEFRGDTNKGGETPRVGLDHDDALIKLGAHQNGASRFGFIAFETTMSPVSTSYEYDDVSTITEFTMGVAEWKGIEEKPRPEEPSNLAPAKAGNVEDKRVSVVEEESKVAEEKEEESKVAEEEESKLVEEEEEESKAAEEEEQSKAEEEEESTAVEDEQSTAVEDEQSKAVEDEQSKAVEDEQSTAVEDEELQNGENLQEESELEETDLGRKETEAKSDGIKVGEEQSIATWGEWQTGKESGNVIEKENSATADDAGGFGMSCEDDVSPKEATSMVNSRLSDSDEAAGGAREEKVEVAAKNAKLEEDTKLTAQREGDEASGEVPGGTTILEGENEAGSGSEWELVEDDLAVATHQLGAALFKSDMEDSKEMGSKE